MERLDRRVVAYWYLAGFVSVLVLSAILFGAAIFVHIRLPDWSGLAWWGASSLAGLNVLWSLISPPWAYARWGFKMDGELMLTRYGIIFHEERAIPVNRMQHIDLSRGPIERLFGLASLVVFSAGNEGAAFRVPGLAVQRAESLRDEVLAARGDDVV